MKYQRLWIALVFSFLMALTSCGNENENITGPSPQPSPGPQFLPEAPGLVGTFSGTVQNIDHTKSGTLTITITDYDRHTGLLTGNLTLTGFSKCFTTGIFDPSLNSTYIPQRGFGSIMAAGPEAGSYSFLEFDRSDAFYNGMNLNGQDGLGFYEGGNYCLLIDPVLLERK